MPNASPPTGTAPSRRKVLRLPRDVPGPTGRPAGDPAAALRQLVPRQGEHDKMSRQLSRAPAAPHPFVHPSNRNPESQLLADAADGPTLPDEPAWPRPPGTPLAFG